MIKPLLLICCIALSACAHASKFTSESMQSYDSNTEYRIDPADAGFTINIYYAKYQALPESNATLASCKSMLTSIAYEYAERQGRKLKPINEQRMKISYGRNMLSGVSSCSATVQAEYQ